MSAAPPMLRGRRPTWIAVALLLVFAALATGSARRLDVTADEHLLWLAGERVLAGDWSLIETCFQGPLPLYLNQLLVRPDAMPLAAGGLSPDELFGARGGMLVSGLLAGWLVFRIARRMFGTRGGLLALASFVLHPLAWGYGALVAVDMTYAAFTLLALDAVLLHADEPRPRLGRAAWAGVACGLLLATKYLALLVAPVLFAFVLLSAARGARAPVRRAALAGALFAAAALVALHGAYGFRAGLGWEGEPVSAAFARALAEPLVAPLLTLAPTPLLRGLDYQIQMGATVTTSYFAGRYAAGHPLYHAVGLLVKTPPAMLLAGAAVLALGVRALLGAGAPRARRDAAWLLLAAGGVPFLYLSLVAKLQVGIRYVLPLVPLGCIALGALAVLPATLRLRAGPRRGLLGAYLAACAVSTALAWPNGIAYFHRLSGGPREAWRLYTDSNADWGQRRDSGLAALRARHPDLVALEPTSGPELGRVAIYVRFRALRDPEAPERPRHWLDPFEPIDHAGAAWLVYDVTAAGWRAAADADPRRRAELALALLGAGRTAEARSEIERLPPERAALPARILALGKTARGDPHAALDLGNAWLVAGRADLALDAGAAAQDGAPPPPPRKLAMLRAQALLRLGRLDEAASALEAVHPPPGEDVERALLLAELYRRTARLDDGIALFEREEAAAGLSAADRARLRAAHERLLHQRIRWQTFQERP